MRVRTLGRLELEDASFGRPKPLLLLAYLVLEGPRDRRHLAELFWPGAVRPMNSLRVALSQLRKGVPGAIHTDGHSVEATIDLDAAGLLGALERGDTEEAVALHRGPFLDGFYLSDWSTELEDWVYGTREFLADRVREAVLGLAERDAALGDFAAAARRANHAAKLPGTPDPEALVRLYRIATAAGDLLASALQTDAEGLGIELDLERSEARRQLLRSAGGAGSDREVRHHLPAPNTSFVGRDPELLDLAGLIADTGTRMITITGAGGVGKTRLALQAAQQEMEETSHFEDAYFVPLDALGASEHIPDAIAGALEFALRGRGDPLQELIDALGDRRLLLILDNFEHLMDGAALLVELRDGCPHLTLLVTSRERLGLSGEQLFPLDGLPVPRPGLSVEEARYLDATQLFTQRARRVLRTFEPTDDVLPDMLELCRLVDGSPLGIELAAGWVRLMPVPEIVAELEHGRDLASVSFRDAPERQQSLRAAFEHSWRLLSERERTALRKLSVFAGGFTREAASVVAGATLPTLAALVDKSLLRVLPTGRFERHPLVHGFTSEKLAVEPDVADEARAAHARWFLALAEEAAAGLRGDALSAGLTRVEREHDNLRAALRWTLDGADADTGLRLATSLYRYWYYRSHFAEGRRWLGRALAATDGLPDVAEVRAKALHAAGVLALEQGDVSEAERLLRARLELAHRLGDTEGRSAALNSLGVLAWGQEDYAVARDMLQESLALRRSLDRNDLILVPLGNLGLVALAQGDLQAAQTYLEEGLALCRRAGDAMGEAIALSNLGAVHVDRNEAAAARRSIGAALPLYRDLGDKSGVAHCLEGLAAVAALMRRFAAAARIAGAAEALREAIGSRLNPSDAARRDRRLASAHAALGADAFSAHARRGRGLELDASIAYALEATDAEARPAEAHPDDL